MGKMCHRRGGCRLCLGSELTRVLTLKPTPPANALVATKDLHRAEEKFPLELYLCRGCGHLQMLDVVDPEILFGDYVYVSGTSPVFVEHFRRYAGALAEWSAPEDSLVVEMGSNDGTLLKHMKALGYRVLGIDPARAIAAEANRNGIETWNRFFDGAAVDLILEKHGPADFVVANNVFAHIDDLRGTAAAAARLLKPEGTFVAEFSYLPDVLQKGLFDTVYHEHLSYHALLPLDRFLREMGLETVHAERVPTHGGSLRVLAQKRGGPCAGSAGLERLLGEERALQLHRPEAYQDFAANIGRCRDKLTQRIRSIQAAGGRIAGFGAPAKATTLVHEFDLSASDIDFIVDDSPWKQGLHLPGVHIPIVPADRLLAEMPNYTIIFAWNFADSIVAKNQEYLRRGGKFIAPLPELKEYSWMPNS